MSFGWWLELSVSNKEFFLLQWCSQVQRTADSLAAAVEDVGVDHGGLDIFVAQEFLDGADTCPDRRCWVS